jgi:transcriptional regulator with XRE-family HTH domain
MVNTMLHSPSAPTPPPEGGADVRKAAGHEDLSRLALQSDLRAGEKLMALRRAKGVTLEQLAAATRLSREHIEALETMDVKLLPGTAYVAPYLRKYLGFVGLPAEVAEKLIEQYKAQSALAREGVRPQMKNPASKPREEKPWMLAAAVALAAIAFVGWRAMKDGAADTRVLPAPSQEASASPSPNAPSVPAAEGARPVVELRATAAAWLEVRGPEGQIFLSRQLLPGEGYRPDVGAGWTLHAKDGGAFTILVNGQAMGTLGMAGSPVFGRRVDAIEAPEAPPPVISAPVVEVAPAPLAAGPAPKPRPRVVATPEAAPAPEAAAPSEPSPAPEAAPPLPPELTSVGPAITG